jgi:RNA polymerase sigma factor (sigma-70 family)
MKELSQLVEAAQAGDSEAYAALVQRFQGMAYTIASRYVGDHHLAQDIVQDAIIEAFLHLPQLKEPSAFPGWFRQIVFRQCTRLLRQGTLTYYSLEAASADLVAESDTEELVMQAEREASVRSALASLPRHEQLVAALFYGCGYSYNEVSAFLKIPITTVKKRLHSARQKLRMQLQATLRDENANARPASNNEAAEIEEIAVRVTRLFNRVAHTLERVASWQTSNNLHCKHSFLPGMA